ncbi:MAG: YbhB/YbcL family Raf kinase inhibitor-like protein [Candidatus Micrarchaeia archaeon]
MKVSSAAFMEGARIPADFTCEGKGRSPPLSISGIPDGARSLAIIMDDPDAPMGTWVHWVVWDIPPVAEIVEGAQGIGKEGVTSARRAGYHGPCPPPGKPHRYFFKVYALDKELSLKPGSMKPDLERAMEGHILAHAELMGTYQR